MTYDYLYVNMNELDFFRDKKKIDFSAQVQDYIEEGIVTYNADCIMILCGIIPIGYVCIGTQKYYRNMILEFFLLTKYRDEAIFIFKQIVGRYACVGWFVNTQDTFSLMLMLEMRLKFDINGWIFWYNHNSDSLIEEHNDFRLVKKDEIEDIYKLIVIDDFYTGGDILTVEKRIEKGEIYSLKVDTKLLGVGFLSVLERTPQYADLAMIVTPDKRNKGYGSLIQKRLINECFRRKLIPTACCDVDNVFSRKTLQKVGFYISGSVLQVQVNQL